MIDIVLLTWPNHPKRLEYFQRMLRALTAKLTASRHKLRWVCGAESEHDPACQWCGDGLAALCAEHGIELHWRPPGSPASLGAGMNFAMSLATHCYLLVQDDFELLEPVDLSPGADVLAADPEVSLIRYSFYTHPTDGTQFFGRKHGFQVVKIDGMWPYGDDPSLRPVNFAARYGRYYEGYPHGASEGDMLHRLVRHRALILATDRSCFGHFGQVPAVPTVKEHRTRDHWR